LRGKTIAAAFRRARHCFSRKNKLPVGGVRVMEFVPLAGVMV
jgi:hypothetical protein